MSRFRLLLILGLSTLLTTIFPELAISQDLWTLEKCISHAWENNLQVKQQELEVERSKNNLLGSKLEYIPKLNGNISHNMNWGRSVDLNDLAIIENKLSQSTSASLGASIVLLDGLSKINTYRSNQTSLNISLQEVEFIKNEISISITRAFLQVLLAKQIHQSTQENFSSISDQRERTKLLVDAGEQAYSALLEIESQLASERVQLVSASNQVRSNTLSLMQLLDLSYKKDFEVFAPSLDSSAPEYQDEYIDNLYKFSVSLPQIKSAELSLEKSKHELNIAKGRFYPTITLSAGYGTFHSTTDESQGFFKQFVDNRNPSLGFSLNIPIFNSWQTKINLRNAKLVVRSRDIDLKSKQQTLYKEIQTVINDASSYYEKYTASDVNLKATEESFRYVEQKFNVGTLNGTDYSVAKSNLFKAQSEYYQAKYQFIFQLKIIDFYKGIPISL